MHHRFLVTVGRDNAQTSEEARNYVYQYLDENGFAGTGRWASGLADWFVIGGRWSGEITRSRLDKEKLESLDKEFEEKYDGRGNIAEYQSLFKEYFPDFQGESPSGRNNYAQFGYDDDAQIIDEQIYETLLKEYEGRGCDFDEDFADLDDEALSRDFIGKKWLVVVDYHS